MKKKFLTICEGGTIRSVSLAFQLKSAGQDAIAASWRWNSKETFEMLFSWADYIIIMQGEFLKFVPNKYHSKTRTVDVGVDRYGNPLHSELSQFLNTVVVGWSARNWNI